MKNKRLLYLLLPAVLVIWGLIFQRIWVAAQGNDGQEPAPTAATISLAESVVSQRPPQLLLNYADPFKASSPAASPRDRPPVASSPNDFERPLRPATLNLPVAPPPVATVPVVWPQLKYLGFINNPRVDRRIALLAIDEKEAMVKAGENRQGVLVTKIFRDSVQLVFQGNKKTIKRNTIN